MPTVSICIANFNGMEIIDECLRSVQEQFGNVAVEILVHDDGSSDGSADYLRAHYPKVTLIESTSNVGFCIANNRLADAAKGKYLLLLNNDAILFPDALQSLLEAAQKIARPAILSLPQFDASSGTLVDRGCLLDPFYNTVPNLKSEQQNVAMVIGACLWIPKALWQELGGFPDWFGSIAEDTYLCCRARLAGHAIRVLSTSGYRHWQGKSFGGGKLVNERMQTTFRRRALSERNKTFVMLLCTPISILLLLLPVHALLIYLEAAMLCIARKNMDSWRKIYSPIGFQIWANRKKLMIFRRDVRAGQSISILEFYKLHVWESRKLKMLITRGLPDLS